MRGASGKLKFNEERMEDVRGVGRDEERKWRLGRKKGTEGTKDVTVREEFNEFPIKTCCLHLTGLNPSHALSTSY